MPHKSISNKQDSGGLASVSFLDVFLKGRVCIQRSQPLLNGSVKSAQQKRERDSGECNGLKPKRDGMLLKENGTTRKQQENQIGGKPVLQNLGIRQVSVRGDLQEEMLSLLLVWDQTTGDCGVCKKKQKKKEEFKLKAVDCPLPWDSNRGRIPQELIAGTSPGLEGF